MRGSTPACPACGCPKVIEISYGLPTEYARKAAAAGELELGGCCVEAESPAWRCAICGLGFGRALERFFS